METVKNGDRLRKHNTYCCRSSLLFVVHCHAPKYNSHSLLGANFHAGLWQPWSRTTKFPGKGGSDTNNAEQYNNFINPPLLDIPLYKVKRIKDKRASSTVHPEFRTTVSMHV